ncbi:MAG TPA: hypothetical protein V6D19_12970 [Stenomitos sp.]
MNKKVIIGIAIAIIVIIGLVVLVGGNQSVQSPVDAIFGGTTNYDVIVFDGVNSTSTTATTQTLAATDIIGYSTILFTPNTGATTLTFPATSTLSSQDFIPRAGQRTQQCWINSTSTVAATIIFAAGTGIDLETSSSTPSDLTIPGGNSACFQFTRQRNSDITAAMIEFSNAD